MNNILTKVNTVNLPFRDQITECRPELDPMEIMDFVKFCYKSNKQLQVINYGDHLRAFTKDKMYSFYNYKNYILKITEAGKRTYFKKS